MAASSLRVNHHSAAAFPVPAVARNLEQSLRPAFAQPATISQGIRLPAQSLKNGSPSKIRLNTRRRKRMLQTRDVHHSGYIAQSGRKSHQQLATMVL
jgi:hypothetical protein